MLLAMPRHYGLCWHGGTSHTVPYGPRPGASLGTSSSPSGHPGGPGLGQGTRGWAGSLAPHLHLLSSPRKALVEGKEPWGWAGMEVSRSREAGGLGTAHLILVSQAYK